MKVDLAEELRRIIKWSLRPDELLQGARTRRTPDGLFPAEVIRVEPEEDATRSLSSTGLSPYCYVTKHQQHILIVMGWSMPYCEADTASPTTQLYFLLSLTSRLCSSSTLSATLTSRSHIPFEPSNTGGK